MPSSPTLRCSRCLGKVEVQQGREGPIALCEGGHTIRVDEIQEEAPCIGCGRHFAVPIGTIWFPCRECVAAGRFGANEDEARARIEKLAAEHPDETVARQVRDGVAAKANERWRKEDEERREKEEQLRRAGLNRQIKATHEAAVARAQAEAEAQASGVASDVAVPFPDAVEDPEVVARRKRAQENHALRLRLAALEAAAIAAERVLTLAELPPELHEVAKATGIAKE